MTDREFNSYRLTSLEEPTDEMLSRIMREAAEEAKIRNEKATRIYFENLRRESEKIAKEKSFPDMGSPF